MTAPGLEAGLKKRKFLLFVQPLFFRDLPNFNPSSSLSQEPRSWARIVAASWTSETTHPTPSLEPTQPNPPPECESHKNVHQPKLEFHQNGTSFYHKQHQPQKRRTNLPENSLFEIIIGIILTFFLSARNSFAMHQYCIWQLKTSLFNQLIYVLSQCFSLKFNISTQSAA